MASLWSLVQEHTKKFVDLDSLQQEEGGEGGDHTSSESHVTGGDATHRAEAAQPTSQSHGAGHGRRSVTPPTRMGTVVHADAMTPPRVLSAHLQQLDSLDTTWSPGLSPVPHVVSRIDLDTSKDDAGSLYVAPEAGRQEEVKLQHSASASTAAADTATDAATATGTATTTAGNMSPAGVGRSPALADAASESDAAPVTFQGKSVAAALSSYYGVSMATSLASSGAAWLGQITTPFISSPSAPAAPPDSPPPVQRPASDYAPRVDLGITSNNSALVAELDQFALPSLLPDHPDEVSAAELGIDMPSLAAAARGPSTPLEFLEWGMGHGRTCCYSFCAMLHSNATVSAALDPIATAFGLSRDQTLCLVFVLAVLAAISVWLVVHFTGSGAAVVGNV